jgi:aspartyl protease family protein
MADRQNNSGTEASACTDPSRQEAEAWIHGRTDPVSPAAKAGRGGTGGGNYLLRGALIFLLFTGMAFLLWRWIGGTDSSGGWGQFAYFTIMALFVSASLASGRIWRNIRHLVIWVGIFTASLAVFSYRYELIAIKNRMVAELIPARGLPSASGVIRFPMAEDGHFHILAEVNGLPVRFLADTGASHIVFSPRDAARLGMDPDRLTFDRFYHTANGTVRGSSIRIDDFRVGTIHLRNIGASVNEAAMAQSLLGMTFFNRLESYEVRDGVLTLRWNS